MSTVLLILAALSATVGHTPPSPVPTAIMDPPCPSGPCRVVVAQATTSEAMS